MKILIVGAGAVGGTFGAKLVSGGHEVAFVARGEHGRILREQGLSLEAPEGGINARGPVFESVEAAVGFGADVALVAVKWPSLEEVAAGTAAALAPGGVAIPLLNGLDVEERLAESIGAERVVGGVAQLAAALVAPGQIRLRAGGMITLAPFVPAQRELVEHIAATFSACFPCHAEPDLHRVRWQKLLWNAPFNAICALTRRRAGEVLALPELDALVRQVMREVLSVARAEGVVLEDSAMDAMIAITHGLFANTEPSMLQDVLAGRETETDQLQGAVVARAERHGVPTPALVTLHALLRGLGPENRK
jgi:2-dehydropantoate 2-reductase